VYPIFLTLSLSSIERYRNGSTSSLQNLETSERFSKDHGDSEWSYSSILSSLWIPDSVFDELTKLIIITITSPPRVRRVKASPMFEKVRCGFRWFQTEMTPQRSINVLGDIVVYQVFCLDCPWAPLHCCLMQLASWHYSISKVDERQIRIHKILYLTLLWP